MKIGVIRHNASTAMMSHSWRSQGREIVEFFINIEQAASGPDSKINAAQNLVEMIRKENPAVIVDVNGVGLLPLTVDANGPWTNDAIHGFWCIWWWNDPRNCFHPLRSAGQEEVFLKAWKNERTVHFIWDEVLVREYSDWTGLSFQWLPTATHPGVFNPDVIDENDETFKKVQLSFLGDCPVAPKKPYAFPDAEDVALLRIKSPELTYFNMREHDQQNLVEDFFNVLGMAKEDPKGPLHPDIMVWKDLVDKVVYTRRCVHMMNTVKEHFKHTYFAGEQWSNEFTHYPAIYDPRQLVERYRSSLVCLTVPSGETFAGTSMQAYEIMACGGVLLCPSGPDFDPMGKMGDKAYIPYDSPEHLVDQWAKYSSRSDKREAISKQARGYVLDNHTWNHRLQDMLKILMRDYVKAKEH